jgi:hypothetical protein
MIREHCNQNEPELRLTKRPLGRLLLDGKFITSEDLERAVEEQKKTGETLGAILLRQGILDQMTLKAAVSAQRDLASLDDALKAAAGSRQMTGDLFVRAGRITQEELSLALDEQKRTGAKIGEVLVRLGFITGKELEAVLNFQRNQGCDEADAVRFRLGEILVASETITYEQLRNALARQQSSGKKLGEILVESGYATRRHVERGLSLQRGLVTAALAAVLTLAHMPDVHAAQDAERLALAGANTMTVSATIRSYARLRVLHQNHELVITNADIRRGFVDAASASRVEIKNNNREGYLLEFDSTPMPFKEVHVTGLGATVVIASGTGWIAQPYTGKTPLTVDLSYRFVLSENTMPGTYSWPLAVSVNPL